MTVSRFALFSGDNHIYPPLIIVLFFCVVLCGSAQDRGDRKVTSSNAAIEELIRKENDKDRKIKLANQYTEVVKRGGDPIELADTYLFLSESFSHSERAVAYTDSIIQATKDIKNNTMYPAEGYLQKGIQLYYLANDREALDYFLKANDLYIRDNNAFKMLVINHYIGLLKNSVNDYEEAFRIFKRNILFFENKANQREFSKQYLKSLYALADAYVNRKIVDSAEIYSVQGIKISLKESNNYLYPHFLFSYSDAKTLNRQYKEAIDSTIKGTTLIKNKKIELCEKYVDISILYDSLNDYNKSLIYLNKIDSIYQKNPQVLLQAEEAYQTLLRKYQNDGNRDKQLEIIEKLLSVDSIIKLRPQNLSRKIVEEYDTPKLIASKEKLIKALEEETNISKTTILILALLTAVLVLGVAYVTRKNIVQKRRFRSLMQQQEPLQLSEIQKEKERPIVVEKTEVVKKVTDLPDEVVQSILERLTRFETSHKFTNKQYTLSSLAKELHTNSAYLSKIINAEKKTSFAHYMNKLRIDYAIEKLKEDSLLRSYTIKAIANEFGFNTAQSFSNAFYKQTGIYPSFFIKQLEKESDN